MNPMIRTRLAYDIHVIAASPAASLAVQSIAGILGIEPRVAADRLSSLPSVLAEKVAASAAQRLSALLSALGMRIRLDPALASPDGVETAGRRRDLALQPIGSFDRPALTARLAHLTRQSETSVTEGLAGPEGLVLRNLTDEQIVRLQRMLRRKANLRMLVTDPQTAVYDAFPTDAPIPVEELKRLGLGRCAFSGAVATGMNRPTVHHLERRVEGSLLFLNRDFLRFDLFIAGTPGQRSTELAGFLESRGQTMKGQGSDLHRIDSDLPHAIAEQFISDYAAIGLDVVAKLRGHQH